MTKASQYRDMSVDEIEVALKEKSAMIYHAINEKNRTKKSEQPHLLRQYKKDKARMLTILNEKCIEQI
jgi:large subunit ribosomal protein L29